MKNKIIIAILTTILLFISTTVAVSATVTESTPTTPPTHVTVGDVIINGSVNNTIKSQTITVNTNGTGFASIAKNYEIIDGDDPDDWKITMPDGLYAKITNGVAQGALSFTITITGEPKKASNEPISITVPVKYLNGGTESLTTTPNSSAKWDIVNSYQLNFSVKNNRGGTLAAKVNGTAVSTGDYVPEGEAVVFTATPATAFKVKEWTAMRDGSSTPVDFDTAASATAKIQTLPCPAGLAENSGTEVDVTVEFDAAPSAYRFDSKQITSDDKTSDGKDFDATVETKMNFGYSIEVDAADAVTTNATTYDINENKDVYVPVTGDVPLDIGVYKYELTPKSANENIAKFEKADDDGKFTITAVGEGTVKLTLTATHVSYKPANEQDASTDSKYKLSDGKIEFTVTVKAAETTLSADLNNKYVVEAESKRIDEDGNLDEAVLIIDFMRETAAVVIAPDTTVAIEGYSLNGTSWIKLSSNAKDSSVSISSVLDKSGNDVRFAEKLSGSKPEGGTAVWKIGKINSLPSAPKTTVVYGKTPGGKGDGTDDDSKWYFGGSSSETAFLYAVSADGKKVEDGVEWSIYDPTDADRGGNIPPWDSVTGKVVKTIYLAKLEPKVDIASTDKETTSLTPSSKTSKVTVSSFLKPPNVRADYKKEMVAVKNGMYYAIGESKGAVPDFDADNLMTKAQVKTGVPFSNIFEGITTVGAQKSVYVYTASTGKRPRSAVREVIVNYYKDFEGDLASGFNVDKHKYKLPRGMEVYDPVKRKWVGSIKLDKTVGKVTEYEVRQKGNAKYDVRNSDTNLKSGTNPASNPVKLRITWGMYKAKDATDKKPEVMKPGVIAVECIS